ncbi:Uu.00g012090.m01.CDS01 [Anthostomella pinea]|uniref:Uu.00g012090.m01.CDS01 n=1 Tax=Anthostomella pinea TaxID=933095 RepID=A0AAI8VYH6_9PEZI|nr:Uu.00g012090.m01.CDS01 [Anthostomella pinea]
MAPPRKLAFTGRVQEVIYGSDETPRVGVAVVNGTACAVGSGMIASNDVVIVFNADTFVPSAGHAPTFDQTRTPAHRDPATLNGVEGIRVKPIILDGKLSAAFALKTDLYPNIHGKVRAFASRHSITSLDQKFLGIQVPVSLGLKAWEPKVAFDIVYERPDFIPINTVPDIKATTAF